VSLLGNVIVPMALAWSLTALARLELAPRGNTLGSLSGESPGPVRLRLRLPEIEGRTSEPLVVCGQQGSATLAYIRFLGGARAKVGMEFWGLGASESQEFAVPAGGGPIEVACYFPALYPKSGDRFWENMPAPRQALLRTQFVILVNGAVRLKGRTTYDQPVHMPIYIGANPLGGSVVSGVYTGSVLAATRPN
jgi:hypothetical protein